jgi:hypothetical protein
MIRRGGFMTVVALCAAGCVGGNGGRGDSPSCPDGTTPVVATVSYADDIRPLLSNSGCLTTGCHGGSFPASGYSLQEYSTSFLPGEQAEELGECNVVPGDVDASYFIEKLGTAPRMGEQMPLLRTPLTDADIELIATWIREGAPNN